jgi:sortase A
MSVNKKHTKNITKIATYILIPILYVAIGVFVVYLIYRPYVDTGVAIINMLDSYKPEGVVNADEPRDLFSESTTQESEETKSPENEENTVSGYDITSPSEGDKYGVLEIECIGVIADLYYDDNADVLMKGVGQYTGSYMPGNDKPILIAGHNNSYFHNIGNLKEGDIIKITTHYGVYEYCVTGHLLSTNHDASAYDLSQDKEQLIIYTCYPFYTLGITPQRWFVYADKISGPKIVY